MTDNNAPQDIEIYVRDFDFESFVSWIESHFPISDFNENAKHNSYKGHVQTSAEARKIEVVVLVGSAGKAFSSVWFKSNQTPWENDLACAESYVAGTGAEVRCSPGSWEEGEDEINDNKWWRITPKDKTLINW